MNKSIFSNEPQSFFQFFKKSFGLGFYALTKTLPLSFFGAILTAGSDIIFGPSVLAYIDTHKSGDGFSADIFYIIQEHPIAILIYLVFFCTSVFFDIIYASQINARFNNKKLRIKQSFHIAKKRGASYIVVAIIISTIPLFSFLFNPSQKSLWASLIFTALVLLQLIIGISSICVNYLILWEDKTVFEAFYESWNLVTLRYYFRIIMAGIILSPINFLVIKIKPWLANYPDAFYMIALLAIFVLLIPFREAFFLNMFYDLKLIKSKKSTMPKITYNKDNTSIVHES